jgi:hypothetical protein
MVRPSKKRLFPEPIKFDWDEGNADKNWIRHHVSQNEAEFVFFNDPKFVLNDTTHSKVEKRFICLGKTKQGRHLFVSFIIRNRKVRVISARDMTSREHQEFEKYEKENS